MLANPKFLGLTKRLQVDGVGEAQCAHFIVVSCVTETVRTTEMRAALLLVCLHGLTERCLRLPLIRMCAASFAACGLFFGALFILHHVNQDE